MMTIEKEAGNSWWCLSAPPWMCVRCAPLATQPVIMNLNTHHNGLLCSHRWWLQRTLSNASWFWKWPSCMLPRDLPRPSSAPRPSNCWQDYMWYTWGELTSVVRATSDDDDDGMCLQLWCAINLMQTNHNVKKWLVISFKKSHILWRSLRGV